ncbi:WD40 repeat domain-containing protein, partial [bacterium]|nr:WD40 repeat domain-containing protein [bacterium]
LQLKNKVCILIILVISICGCSAQQTKESPSLAIFHSIAISPDSKYIAAGRNAFNIVFIYDAETLEVVKTLKGLQEDTWGKMSARSLTFSPDGKFLAAAGIDRAAVVWDVISGEIVLHLSELKGVVSIDYSPDGSTLAVAGLDGAIRCVDMTNGEVTTALKGHEGEVLSIAFSPDGRMIASGGADRSLRLWDVGTKQQVPLFEGHRAPVLRIAFSPDGRRMASTSTYEVKIWQIETGKDVKELTDVESIRAELVGLNVLFNLAGVLSLATSGVGTFGVVTSLEIPLSASFSPDDRFLALTVPKKSLSGDYQILIYDLKNDKVTPIKKAFFAVAFSPNGKFLAAVGSGIRLFDPLTGKEIIPDKTK